MRVNLETKERTGVSNYFLGLGRVYGLLCSELPLRVYCWRDVDGFWFSGFWYFCINGTPTSGLFSSNSSSDSLIDLSFASIAWIVVSRLIFFSSFFAPAKAGMSTFGLVLMISFSVKPRAHLTTIFFAPTLRLCNASFACSASLTVLYVMNAYPLGWPACGPDRWNSRSNH